jgi:hypothetical protein
LGLFPLRAAAIAFHRHHLNINSTELIERLNHEKTRLIVAGEHFKQDHSLRMGLGLPPDYLQAGLDRIHELIVELQR